MKKINEAHARLDLSGLESDDLQTLSEILRLAGQSESTSVDQGLEPDMSLDISDPMQSVGSDIGDVGFSTEDEPSMVPDEMLSPQDMSPEIETIPTDSLPQEPVSFQDESGFDVDELVSLSGIHESEDEEEEILEAFLPDMFLDESPEEQHGPFMTEREAVYNATKETNGVENEHFIINVRGNRFYWERMVKEDVQNRPEPEEVNTDGIINSRHVIKDKKIGLGDNHLKMPVSESELQDGDSGDLSVLGNGDVGDDEPINEEDDEDLEESTKSIFESINKRFDKFMGE